MKGFTLIELLTVVVIAGILASIALPQYQRAIEKSRAAQAITMGKTIIDAQNRLLDLAPDDSTDTRNALDVILTGGSWNTNDRTATVYTTDLFTYTLSNSGVIAERNGGSFSGYMLTFYNNRSGAQNTCSGNDFCSNMRSMGFTIQD